ncbi:MAG: hypothetical protein HY862_13100 [Chloroflexi bacterium]|nr:hypothetical protein [Chloroflexota bacterium]
MKHKIVLFLTVLLTLFANLTNVSMGGLPRHVFATEPTYVQSIAATIPRPHLGYGIHVAPNTTVDLGWVDRLGMDWVKVYTDNEAGYYRNKKVLFRYDLIYPGDNGNWSEFKAGVRARALKLVDLGVEAVEVHNEPNLQAEWPGPPNAWQYTQMLRVVYTEIKAVAPQLIVVSAGLAPTVTTPSRDAITDVDFAREMFENGAGDYFDAFGYHPYGYNAPPEDAPNARTLNYRRTEMLRDLMVEYGLGSKPIWLTEFGWLRDPAEEGLNCLATDLSFAGFSWMKVSGQTQADYIVRAFDFADKNWAWAGPMFLWNLNWSMLGPGVLSQCNHMRWFSILRSDGQPTLALNSVAAMPRRPVREMAEMTLVAMDDMTVEIGYSCPAIVEVGQFQIRNTGYPGTGFDATIEPAISLSGPEVTVSPAIAASDDVITVYADTTGLTAGLYVIYINVDSEISGAIVSQNIRGYVVVTDSFSDCQ